MSIRTSDSVEDDGDGLVELCKQFLQPGIILAGEQCREILHSIELAFCRSNDVLVTILIDVEPMDEQTVAQAFFFISRLAEVEHRLAAIGRKELLNDGEDGLSELLVSRRATVPLDVDAELIGSALNEGVFEHETDSISQPKVCIKIEGILVALCLTHQIR